MIAQQIVDYLYDEHVAHSKDSQVTRVYVKSGEMWRTYFLMANQKDELLTNNKWIFIPIDDPFTYFELNGEDIESLKGGAEPFK